MTMRVFSINNSQLMAVRERGIDLEKQIQNLTEGNLETAFGLQFVASEFPLHNFRVDTLAFDKERNAFVIVEYKRDKSLSVIDQGYAYLALLLNNKGEFVLEYNERTKGSLRRQGVDWSQSRVLFLAQSFTTFQRNAINFRDLPIELWEVKVFDNATILYNQLLSPEASESIKTVTKNQPIETVTRELKVYTLEDHVSTASQKARSLFYPLREKVLALGDDIEERPQKLYVAFRTQRNFVEIEFQKQRLKIHLDIPRPDLDDPKNISRDMKNIGHFGTGETEFVLEKPEETSYALTPIEQAYRRSKQST